MLAESKYKQIREKPSRFNNVSIKLLLDVHHDRNYIQ